jgi:hypothetical protein
MNSLPDPISFVPEDFLASTADLVGVLAQFAISCGPHSLRGHRHQQIVEAALYKLLPMQTPVQLPSAPPVAPEAFYPPARQPTVAREAARTSGERVPVKRMGGSRPERRRYCKCGQCEWCLSNARWDRIFNEKFAYPAYYGHLVVRHNSTLAEAR